MDKYFRKAIWLLMLLLSISFYAQKDVTQFLDIPVDGFKAEMVQKLKSKGFVKNRDEDGILDGDFNGVKVKISVGTNNNKVWRIAVIDVNPTNETNIKIRFNNLIQQFQNNKRYSPQSDTTIAKYIIPKTEDISYEMSIKNKRYEAVFYQKSIKHDSLIKEIELLMNKSSLNEKEKQRLEDLNVEISYESLNSLNKTVWFLIIEDYGEYRIAMFYDNEYNKANGEGL
ncbi:hypothetical protein OGH69_05545 [Flavobacterium sp. MFBS3-15]|uniref:hypothetical protein n=1 Tax=Flavobacterium sp. MFBS3-15 TaxID=2989816 RepID=UPI002235B98A|nr:hypothetical protein [Flavobacterium sp. MFBS3-15]MCW4468420.1 hypothetical protein [Flavobacterium sp. MFBS3-15]